MASRRRNAPMPVQTPVPPRARPSRVPAALSMLDTANVPYELVPADPQYLVAGAFHFWPHRGFWKALEGGAKGYDARSLIEAVASKKAAGIVGLGAVAEIMAAPALAVVGDNA